jgi:hypothetical protein
MCCKVRLVGDDVIDLVRITMRLCRSMYSPAGLVRCVQIMCAHPYVT